MRYTPATATAAIRRPATRTSTPDRTVTDNNQNEFLNEAQSQNQPGLMGEFAEFLRENAKWWLTPILLVMGLLGVLLILGGTGVAPFIYSLF